MALGLFAGLAAGCNCDQGNHPPDASVVTVTVTPATLTVLAGGPGVVFTATVTGSSGAPTWSLVGPGSLSGSTGPTVTWTSPSDVPARRVATLTATVEGKSASATIDVDPQPVVSVAVSASSGCLVTAQTLQLTAFAYLDAGVLSEQAVTWSSSDPSVATVDDRGQVSAVGRGRAEITAAVGVVRSQPMTVVVYPPPTGVVAYSAADGDGGRRQVHLLTLSLDGGADQVLAEGWAPSLSPDTNLVAYQRGGTAPTYVGYPNRYDTVYTFDRAAGTERLLFSNPSSYVNLTTWSLDGTKVLLDFDLGLGSVNPDGTGSAYFYTANGYDDGPDVNPADGRIAFWNVLAGGGLFTITSSSTGRTLVPGSLAGDGFQRWSPDGGLLSFARYEADAGQYTVYVTPLDGGLLKLFPVLDAHTHGAIGVGAPPPAGAWTAEGAWAVMPAVVDDVPGLYAVPTDGSGCAVRIPSAGGATADYVSQVRAPASPAVASLAVSPALSCLMTPEALQLSAVALDLRGEALDGGVTWSSDDAGVVRVSPAGLVTPVGDGTTLVRASAGGKSAAVQVTVGLHRPRPQGLLAYSASGGPGGARQVHLLRLDGGPEEVVAEGWYPALSPDGTQLTYQRSGTAPGYVGYPNQYDTVYLRSLDGGAERTLFSNPSSYVNLSAWSPDGGQVLYDFDTGLAAVKPDGTGAAYFYTASGYDDGPDVNPVDGRIAFWNIQGFGGITTITAAYGGRTVVPGTAPADAFPRWSADGAWLSYARYDATAAVYSPFVVRPDGTSRTQLFPVVNSHTHGVGGNGGAGPAAWTADGRWVITAAVVNDVRGLYAVATDGTGCWVQVPAAAGATSDSVSAVR